jgi:hypothetical protein
LSAVATVGADADAAVVALEHEEAVVAEGDQSRGAAPLGRGLHAVGVLADRLPGEHVELHDAREDAVAPALVEHRALQHRVGEAAVGADRESLEAAVGALAGLVAGVAGEVGQPGRAVARDQVGRRGEASDQRAVAVELVERRAVLVGDEQRAGDRVDDEALGIEGVAQHARRIGGDPVERRAAGGEADGLLHLEAADLSGDGVDAEREALHPRLVVQRAAAGSAVGEPPPLAAVLIVVQVGEEAEAAVEGGAGRQVEGRAVDRDPVDELDRAHGLGVRRRGDRDRRDGCGEQGEAALHRSPGWRRLGSAAGEGEASPT